jgi:hypothetical protein
MTQSYAGISAVELDKSQPHMANGVVRDRRQGFGQLCFGRSKGRQGIDRKGIYALDRLSACQSNQRVDVVGIGERGPMRISSWTLRLTHSDLVILDELGYLAQLTADSGVVSASNDALSPFSASGGALPFHLLASSMSAPASSSRPISASARGRPCSAIRR